MCIVQYAVQPAVKVLLAIPNLPESFRKYEPRSEFRFYHKLFTNV